MPKSKILIVDDEPATLRQLGQSLRLQGYETVTAATGAEGILRFRSESPDMALLDINLPDMTGIDVLRRIKEDAPDAPAVMMSGEASFHTAVEATRLGANDFFEKPVAMERLVVTIEKALEFSGLKALNRTLRQDADATFQMVGDSPPILKLQEQIKKVGPSKGTVLITGENGSGKELVARAVHTLSPRSEAPFIKINCAAIPENLIESELFGHEKGSFTGATARRLGKFELADNGTLFLDEIGDMKFDMQAKLLRALQEGEFERVGGSQTIQVNVRIIAATNRDIKSDVNEGRFREDLYYRLNVVPLRVPPLRDRPDDVPALAGHFIEVSSRENGLPARKLTKAARAALRSYSWPGNVRELRNLMERLVILGSSPEVSAEEMRSLLDPRPQQASDSSGISYEGTLQEAVRAFESAMILERLRRNRGQMAQTARDLGLERSHLYKKMKSYGISKEDAFSDG